MRKGASYIQEKGKWANWIGHILRRNFLLTCVIDGKTEKWQWREKEEKCEAATA
jgi:hypothetical protein